MGMVLLKEKLQASGLVAELPRKKKPQLIVNEVPSNEKKKEFLSALRQQNLDGTQNSKFQEGDKCHTLLETGTTRGQLTST